MQLLAKAKKIPTDNCFIIFDWNECLKMLAPHSLLVSHWPRSPWPPFDPFIHNKCDFMWTLSLSSLATGQDKSCLSTFFLPLGSLFFFLLHSFTNMEHDVRDLNRLITSSKAIEYTAGKYFYQSFYTWIIRCSESCYNKPIFPPLLISLTLSLKSQGHLIHWLF